MAQPNLTQTATLLGAFYWARHVREEKEQAGMAALELNCDCWWQVMSFYYIHRSSGK